MTPEPAADEKVTFVVDGKRIHDGEPWEETFTLLDEIPPGAHIDLINSVSIGEDGEVGWLMAPIVRFIRAVLVPDDEVRWDLLIRDKDRPLERAQMGALMFWITGEKAGRPTGRQPSSSDGLPIASNGSEAAASSPAETPTGSTPPD